ncbi:hypothetical protein BOO92_21200 [Vibrio navarrensis]|uniref:hypothetical protein n=1 Tax=Vibrio TaxID=662 RepID=UPI0005F05243|nr:MULTISPECIES: hypothetical protein [Vibrio]KJR33182.1 hypothetical protein UF06_06540 [Vibrio sp. S234-5]MBE3654968.1 hypothetical protein [Vibrio navarrensis]MBE3659174.1 hypothetical protein [Vibrio navarrensis]
MSLCYMCDRPATSVEHVPPKCLFPEKKDLSGDQNLRKSLITVPSCDLHNSSKSKDDEYLLNCLTISVFSNTVAKNHFDTKITRSIKRRPQLINKLTENANSTLIENFATGEYAEAIAFKIDAERLKSCLVHISHALYFHHFRERWRGTVDVTANFLFSQDSSQQDVNNKLLLIDELSEKMFKSAESYGENKDVFAYKVMSEQDSKGIRMSFYGANKVTAIFNKNG